MFSAGCGSLSGARRAFVQVSVLAGSRFFTANERHYKQGKGESELTLDWNWWCHCELMVFNVDRLIVKQI